ncbi:DUF4974 domain-containing protein [Chitinophaga sp. SYP-B3965]|uniref:FecR family protein n=1 Tax=Chitinophaga sp. SYP-B3965 TaxID=2663120 RepID=UPI00129975CA|nr:FecR family protein [Chitinophaga sp. SYP-B3965]MRG45271.1 DUF4974 domain-containing protein [Chitinophaga sp. SYP-B3965]
MAAKYNKEYLERLAAKVLDGKATEAEKVFLQAYYDAFDKGEEFTAELSGEDREILKHEIKSSLLVGIGAPKGKVIPFYKRIVAQTAAAAAVLLIGLLTFYWYRPVQPMAITSGIHENDIAPGSDKAILTLSNGQQVILTGAKNGQLAMQGNTAITKSAEGEVIYDAKGGSSGALTYNTISTPRGGQFKISLPDGSRVWLNAASSLTFPASFPDNERKVQVTGEVYFEVAHNRAKPFRVVFEQQVVEVLGTHFNINAYQEEPVLKTTLLEGKINLVNKQQSVILLPGQQASVKRSVEGITVAAVDIKEAAAWKDGLFVFNKASIQEVMRTAARWYDVEVEYQGNLEHTRFGGTISRYKNISELLDNVGIVGGFSYKIEGRKVILMK